MSKLPTFIDWLRSEEGLTALEKDEDFIADVRNLVASALCLAKAHPSRDRLIAMHLLGLLEDIYYAWCDEQEALEEE